MCIEVLKRLKLSIKDASWNSQSYSLSFPNTLFEVLKRTL